VFADIAGFTSMSEQLDFEDVRDIADRCAEVMGEEVRRFGGTVLNVMGDAVMAVFGAPVAHDNDPERAVRAALAMVEAIPRSTPPEYNLALHVGVNTGEVMAGLLGPMDRKDYTVMGDAINTGARLEAAAVRGEVVVGRETYLATRHVIHYEPHEPVTAKGKQEEVEAWLAVEPLPERAERAMAGSQLIGREREMERLRGLWRSTVGEPRAHFVTLVAHPGLGKTRLGREFSAEVEADGGLVLSGRSLPFGESTGYRPFADQVRAAAGLNPGMTPAEVASQVSRHVTDLLGKQPDIVSNLLAMLGLAGDEVVPEKNILFYSARRWLVGLSRRKPTLLLFEDVHWADATLLELIGSLASRVGQAPVMLLCLARPELLDLHPEWGAGQAAYSAITIEPLSDDAAREMSARLLGDQPADVVARLAAASGGNPLFVEELSATVTEQDGGVARDLPTSVKAIIGARLDILQEEERGVLLDAAVIGDVFWRGPLDALAAGVDVAYGLDELQARGLVRQEEPSLVPGDQQFVFKHALIREVAYGRLPRRARRERHATVAAHLEAALGSQRNEMASLLAHHWDEGGEGTKAAGYYVVAADRASKAWAKLEAIALYSRAIEIHSDANDAAAVADLRVRRARGYWGVGDTVSAAADLEEALPHLDGADRARALLDRSRVAFLAVDADNIVHYAGLAAEAAAALDDHLIAAGALAIQASATLMAGRLDEGIEMAARSAREWPNANRDGDPDYADNMANQALYHYWRGDYELALPLAREAVNRALALQALQASAQGTAHLALILAGLGRHQEAMEWFEKSVNLGLEWEVLPRFSGRSMNMWAGSVRELLDFKQARSLSERGLEMSGRAKFPPGIHSAEIDLFILDLLEGRLGKAEKALPALIQATKETKGFHNWLFDIRVAEAEARLALALGRPETGVERARHSLAKAKQLPRKKYQAQGSTTLALCLLGAGQAQGSVDAATEAIGVAEALGHPPSLWRAADALSRAQEAIGDDTSAEASARRAAAEIDRFRAGLEPAARSVFDAAPEAAEVSARAPR
jgi:class 3 adenylate cyclase/predicted ATPase